MDDAAADGDGEGGARPEPIDVFRDADRLADEFEAVQIEPLRRERPIAHEEQQVRRGEAERRLHVGDRLLRSGESIDPM